MDFSIECNGIRVDINTPNSDKFNEIAKRLFSHILNFDFNQTPKVNRIYQQSEIRTNINPAVQDSYEKTLQARLLQMKDAGVIKLTILQVKEFVYKSAYWLYFDNSTMTTHMSEFMDKYSCSADEYGKYLYEAIIRVAIETNYITQP